MNRLLLVAVAAIVVLGWLSSRDADRTAAAGNAVCAGPPLRSLEARNQAMEDGYVINRDFDCIDKTSFAQIEKEKAAWELAQAGRRHTAAKAQRFADARQGFATVVAVRDEAPLPLPEPPERLFVRSDYRNAKHHVLPGYVSPDPGDGKRHPAIVWITGGDSNSLSDFWVRGPEENDQSAAAFREAGIIMAFPTLRGGNGHDSAKEFLLGEVDDVRAAAEQLAQLSYVDPARLYLGGHSTGGTLALLAAETRTPFKAVFAFGPVARADAYGSMIPVDFARLDPMELKLRSPVHWLADIAQPTYVIEGRDGQSNIGELESICAASRNPLLRCIRVAGRDHFSVLASATRIIAARIAGDAGVPEFTQGDF
jgi:acetyl esterase/lipase